MHAAREAISDSLNAPEAPRAAAPSRRSLASWVEPLVCSAADDQELRHRKVLLALAAILVMPAGLIWGALYFAFGERTAAAFPVGYAVLTLIDLVLLVRLRRYELFRLTQQFLILVLPFALQLALGGFAGSGLVIIWAFLSVLMAVLFGGTREALGWFLGFIAVVGAATALQPRLDIRNRLPHELVLAFYLLNVAAVSLVSFLVLRSFVNDRRKLRQLEVAFLNQELALRNSEKLATLGTLAAGIAHELNNPAAAARRGADQLRDAFAGLEQAFRRLGCVNLDAGGREMLAAIESRARERAAHPDSLEPLVRADREAAIEEWCGEHRVPEPWELAPALVSQGIDPAFLDSMAGEFPGEALSAVLQWAARVFPVYTLLHEISESSGRISEIVGALRSYSYLGQGPVQSVDLHEGLDNTLVILRNKLKAGITVERDYGADVPRIMAYGSELNQVWTNLLDNAADAMGGRGRITIRTRRQGESVIVEIEDDGPGIPEEIRPRVFDPFFTTKPPGRGTGLGLSTSHSIVTRKHKGEIRVESHPGSTRFIVRLPVDLTAGSPSENHPKPPEKI